MLVDMKNYTKEALEKTSGALTTQLYDRDFLETTLMSLTTALDDLDIWSVYNEDKYSEEVSALRKHLEHIKDSNKIPF